VKPHPTQKYLDAIWKLGHVPQIIVNAGLPGVVVPDSVRNLFKGGLPIDLDPACPLDLNFSDFGLSADLTFQDKVFRCFFPWVCIHAVVNRHTGEGIVLSVKGPRVTALRGSPLGLVPADVPTARTVKPKATLKVTTSPARTWTPRVIKGGKA